MDDRTRDQLESGREAFAAGEYDKAERALEPLAQSGHPFADVYGMLGVIHYSKGRAKPARAMLEEAVRINPAYTEATMNLALVLNDMGDYEAAKVTYQNMITNRKEASGPGQLDPFVSAKIANMHATVGTAYDQSGRFKDAAREFERALELCPTFVDIRTKLGSALKSSGDLDGARREFERAKKDHPRLLSARLQLGLVHFEAGRKDEAAKEWREVLSLEPGNKFAKLYLGLVGER